MRIVVTKEETRELIVAYDSEQGNSIVKVGYEISVTPSKKKWNRWAVIVRRSTEALNQKIKEMFSVNERT